MVILMALAHAWVDALQYGAEEVTQLTCSFCLLQFGMHACNGDAQLVEFKIDS